MRCRRYYSAKIMRPTIYNTVVLVAMLQPTYLYGASSFMSLEMSTLSLGLRQSRWRRPFSSRFIPLTKQKNGKAVLHATPPSSAHPPPQYHHHHYRQGEPSIRSAIRTMRKGTPIQDVRYSQFLKLVNKKRIEKVTFNADGTQLIGQLYPPKKQKFFSFKKTRQQPQPQQQIRINHLPNDPELLTTLTNYNIDISVASSTSSLSSSSSSNIFYSIIRKVLFPISIFASLFFMFRSSRNSSGSPLAMARMKPSFNFYPTTNVTFNDVAGCDGAKLELAEVVDFLNQPQSYTDNGCIIPRGVLLYGPPGTGE